jgi:nitrite reductase/ring-hydroxylating ferredoxin subunit
MKVPLIEAARVPEGQVAEVDFFGRPVILLRQGEDLRAYVNACTHLGGPLALSEDGAGLTCQWHHACFDARTGKVTAPPAPRDSRLIRLPIRIEDGEVVYVYGE